MNFEEGKLLAFRRKEKNLFLFVVDINQLDIYIFWISDRKYGIMQLI